LSLLAGAFVLAISAVSASAAFVGQRRSELSLGELPPASAPAAPIRADAIRLARRMLSRAKA
jgi:hypothetical protein